MPRSKKRATKKTSEISMYFKIVSKEPTTQDNQKQNETEEQKESATRTDINIKQENEECASMDDYNLFASYLYEYEEDEQYQKEDEAKIEKGKEQTSTKKEREKKNVFCLLFNIDLIRFFKILLSSKKVSASRTAR